MDEPDEPEDEPGQTADGEDAQAAEVSALAELALCENLSQTSGWAARWSASMAGADGALLWAPDTVHPLFLCIGAHGEGLEGIVRRSVPRESGIVHDLVRDRSAIALDRSELAASGDPFVRDVPESIQACLAVPLEAEGIVVGLLALFFERTADTDETLARIDGFLQHAAPALGRALRSERKTVGMLHAIERLTNLYDLSKAFGSTIDTEELATLVVRKAVDFASAEVASLWLLDGDEGEVSLAATAVNENYEVEAPAAVGVSIVGDVIADQSSVRRNRIPESDPFATENEGYRVRSLLAMPLIEEEATIGALALVNKRGRHPEFSPEDEELLQDLARQAVRALRTARQHEAEKKVEELDALLAVSREITSTLDLDKVMNSIVNATSALIHYDRCGIAIQQKGKLRLGAISGAAEVDRRNPDTIRMEELLQWVFLSGTEASITQTEDGEISADRPETEEKFRALFGETGLRSFYGVVLRDEEGKLGALAFESKEPLLIDEGSKDLLAILVNQATVAVRNAQLYQQVPLSGFWKPLLEKRRKLSEIPRSRRRAWAIAAAATALVLFLVPWRLKISGPARVLPAHRASVTAGVDGIIKGVLHREGDRVEAGQVIATLRDEGYRAALADAQAGARIAESEVSQHTQSGDAAAMFAARSRQENQLARVALEQDRLSNTLLRSPVSGVIMTPHIDQRVGQFLAAGAELCVVADTSNVMAEVAISEADVTLLKPGESVALKMNPYPTRTFRGRLARVGAEVRQESDERFVLAEAAVSDPDGLLRAGMLGKAKVSAGTRRVGTAIFRKPARYLWLKLWPMLP
jgi:RND family efflux transporter MFP subunit